MTDIIKDAWVAEKCLSLGGVILKPPKPIKTGFGPGEKE